MIRVNLLKSAGATGSVAATASAGGAALTAEVQKEAVKRLAAILAAVALLYVYNMYVIAAQHDRLNAITAETGAIEAKKTALGPTTPLVEKYNAEKKTLEGQ